MLGIKEIRKINVLKMLNYIKRKDFAALIGMEYGLLTQYLSMNATKAIGDKTAQRITSAFGLNQNWLDHEHEEEIIKQVVLNKINATQLDVPIVKSINTNESKSYIHSPDYFKILPLTKILEMNRGEDLIIQNVQEYKHAIYIPQNINSPIAFEIKGLGYNKPYKNGFLLLCDQASDKNSGDDVILETFDDKIYCGEFLFERNGIIELESIDGTRDAVSKELIKNTYVILSFLSPSLKINYLS